MNSKLHGSTKSVKSIFSLCGEKFFERKRNALSTDSGKTFIDGKTLKKSSGKYRFHGLPGDMNA